MTESGDAALDASLLREAITALLDHPGEESTHLDIRTADGPVRVEMPAVSTGYTPGMVDRLEDILGPDSVRLETFPETEEAGAAAG